MGMLKKAASLRQGYGRQASGSMPAEAASRRQVAILPCSRTPCTLRASKWLRPCWIDPSERLRACFFEHSLPLTMRGSFGAFLGYGSVIFNRLNMSGGHLFQTPTLFAQLQEATLAQHSIVAVYKKGESIFREGCTTPWWYLLKEGTVKYAKCSPQGRDVTLKDLLGRFIASYRIHGSRSLSQIRRIYCGCAGFGQIFRSFSGNVEKGRQPSPRRRQTSQLRSRAFGVLTYSVYAPRAKSPAALLDGLFEHFPFSLNSPTIRLTRWKHLTPTRTAS